MKLGQFLRTASELVAFPHTVFALPFALMATLEAARGLPPPGVLGWVLVAMVGARTAAMAFNRLADHALDAQNPRTAGRPLPSGRMPRSHAWGLVFGGSALLVGAASQLNPLCFALSPVALAWILAYSYTKRFTSLSHLWLGTSLGFAPVGAWLAVKGQLELPPLLLGLGVCAWVAGFDVLYSLQDEAFDRAMGLFSLPARWGRKKALLASRLLHGVAAFGFAAFAQAVGAGFWGWLATALAGVLLLVQHLLVGPGRLDRIHAAFFTTNGVLSLVMLLFYSVDIISTP